MDCMQSSTSWTIVSRDDYTGCGRCLNPGVSRCIGRLNSFLGLVARRFRCGRCLQKSELAREIARRLVERLHDRLAPVARHSARSAHDAHDRPQVAAHVEHRRCDCIDAGDEHAARPRKALFADTGKLQSEIVTGSRRSCRR